eukprot:7264746-Prymnesium_polylepis.1
MKAIVDARAIGFGTARCERSCGEVGASLGRSVPSGHATRFSIPRLDVPPEPPATHALVSATGFLHRRRRRRCRNPTNSPVSVRPRARSQEVHQVRRRTTDTTTVSSSPLVCSQDAAARRRLRCAEHRLMVGCDWPEHRCTHSFAPTEPPDLTAVRLQACAAGHNIIGK